MSDEKEMLETLDAITRAKTDKEMTAFTKRLAILSAFAKSERRKGAIEENKRWLEVKNEKGYDYITYYLIEKRNKELEAQEKEG